MWKGTGRKQKKGAESCQEQKERVLRDKGRKQEKDWGPVAKDRHKEHAAGLVKAGGRERVAAKAGAVVLPGGQHPARVVAAEWAVADVESDE